MNGTSKARTHRALNPRMELLQAFPDIQHNQAKKMLAGMKRKESNKDMKGSGLHPCLNSHVAYMSCLRRYPDTYIKRCNVAANAHAQCVRQNASWVGEKNFDHLQFLEHFKIFAESKTFRKSDPKNIMKQGSSVALHFATSNDS
jgi:hypothetical protein